MAIRFQGIAAPESGEPGSAEATEAIEALVLGKEVRYELTGKRTYDRCVAVCYLDRADIARQGDLVAMSGRLTTFDELL